MTARLGIIYIFMTAMCLLIGSDNVNGYDTSMIFVIVICNFILAMQGDSVQWPAFCQIACSALDGVHTEWDAILKKLKGEECWRGQVCIWGTR